MTNYGSFTSGYEQFLRKPVEEVDDAIRSSVIVLDTNAVLNLYRMKPSARGEYLEVLKKIAPRIWIPRQVADEFYENRLSSVAAHVTSLTKKSEAVSEAAEGLKAALRDFYKLHSLADGRANEYLAPLNDSIAQITQVVEKEVAEFDLTPQGILSGDPILEHLAAFFDGRVGPEFSEEEREEAKREALRRGEQEMPPGYVDVRKKKEEGVGDYFIWSQMLDKAKSDSVDILFVSTDTKEDWVRIQCGLSVGPRVELVREMRRVAGTDYHQLPLAVFLTRAARVLDVKVSQDTIDQVNMRNVEERRNEARRKEIRQLALRQEAAELEVHLDRMRAMMANYRSQAGAAEQRVQMTEEALALVKIKDGTDGADLLEDATVRSLLHNRDAARQELYRILDILRSTESSYASLEARRSAFQGEIEGLRDQ
ncbi:PIN-like domain-containing protein [Streptomyces sp. NPDC001137]|uniref:PIN-like domain-containing protein n=1 Tax=Streptomyces sp. NPDC001137 TaxID=3154378 RepID=UPI00332ECAC6